MLQGMKVAKQYQWLNAKRSRLWKIPYMPPNGARIESMLERERF
jgi:hypothetical protein